MAGCLLSSHSDPHATSLHTPLQSCSSQTLKFRLNLFKLKEGRDMPPKMFGHLVSNILYEKR